MIDTLANLKARLDSVKRMTQIRFILVRRYQRFQIPGTSALRLARDITPDLRLVHQRLTPPSTIQLVHYINSSPVFIHIGRNRSRRPAPEGGRRILLDNSRVYVRFLPFVSGRVHLTRISAH